MNMQTCSMVLALVFGAGTAWADEPAGSGRPLWEVGLAAGVGHVPDYPGSDKSHTRGIVLPYAVYRGPVLRVDEGGVRGRVFESPDWSFDLSATAAFNARDNADTARAGMPGLDYLFGVGPQWVYKGLRTRCGGPTLHLKMRALMSTDFKRIDERGFSIDPEARWRFGCLGGTTAALTVSLQPTWASRELHAYFYEVEPSQATAARPAYRARSGYLGTDLGLTLSQRTAPDLSWFISARLSSLHGAANADSPLLRERSNVTIGAGVIWTPWRSSARAAD